MIRMLEKGHVVGHVPSLLAAVCLCLGCGNCVYTILTLLRLQHIPLTLDVLFYAYINEAHAHYITMSLLNVGVLASVPWNRFELISWEKVYSIHIVYI